MNIKEIKIGQYVSSYFGGGFLVGHVEEIKENGLVVCKNIYPQGNNFERYADDLQLGNPTQEYLKNIQP